MGVASLIALTAALTTAPEGWIAYVSGTEQQSQRIQLLDVAHGDVRFVGAGSHDGAPAWSPDGKRIAYHSKTDDGLMIRVVDAMGKEDQIISRQFSWNHDPQWSSDGCGRPVCKAGICGRYVLYTADAGNGLQSRIVAYDTTTGTEAVWAGGTEGMMAPVWLPSLDLTKALNAEEIVWPGVDSNALLSELEGKGGLLAVYLLPRGTGLTTELVLVSDSQAVPLLPLLPGSKGESERYEEWGLVPDRRAKRLAYETNDGGNREIYMLHRKGLTNVSNHRAADWGPVWSPDGEWLAFQSFRGARGGVYRAFPDTALVQAVDASPDYTAWHPTWSPDSEWIVYVSDASGNPELYIARATGEDRRVLTDTPGIDDAPAWQPEVKE